jgi:hypothetical protein
MKIKAVMLALALGGCVTEPDVVSEAFLTPDGAAGHIVYCGGEATSIAECYDDARKICGGNYLLISEDVGTRILTNRTSTENRSIKITCA